MKYKIVILLLAIIPLILVIIWFKDSKLIATGEEGLWMWQPSRTLQLSLRTWVERGTGQATVFFLPRTTFLIFASVLNLFLPSWLVQAISFYILILVALFSMFYLTKEILEKKNLFIQFLSSTFYLFNLYSLSQVWNRFLLTGIFAWACLPLFTVLFVKWLKTGRKIFLFLVILTSIVFSNAYGTTAFVITLWLPTVIWLLFNFRRHFLRLVIGVISWIGFSLWWIYPYFSIGGSSLTDVNNWQNNLGVLKAVSQFFGTNQIMVLKQVTYFRSDNFGGLYTHFLTTLLSLIVLFFVAIGIYKSKKFKTWKFLIVGFSLAWFLNKGTNPPFGTFFYSLLFKLVAPAQVLRNSYEKLGIFFLAFYSIYWGIGVTWLISKFKKPKMKVAVLLVTLILVYGVLVIPFWNGQIFGAGHYNTRVEVPSYINQANLFFNLQQGNFRILNVPMLPGDGVRYDWPNGYFQGIEPSEYLFDKPVISKSLGFKIYDNKFFNLYNQFVSNNDYDSYLDQLNIKYLLLREDMDTNITPASNSATVRKILESNPKIKLVNVFDKLSIYEYQNFRSSLFSTDKNNGISLIYKKINSQHYKVKINNASAIFNLIFRETYNQNWVAKAEGKEIGIHEVVFDYANSWEIDKAGNYELDIVYKVWPWD